MKSELTVKLLLVVLPLDVFAHAGHVEWHLAEMAGRSEWVEASLVLGALGFYLISRAKQTSSLKTSRIHRQNHRK